MLVDIQSVKMSDILDDKVAIVNEVTWKEGDSEVGGTDTDNNLNEIGTDMSALLDVIESDGEGETESGDVRLDTTPSPSFVGQCLCLKSRVRRPELPKYLSVFGRVFSYLYDYRRRLRLVAIQSLLEAYRKSLKSIYMEEDVPGDISAILELALGSESNNTESSPVELDKSMEEEKLENVPNNGDTFIMKLQQLLALSLVLLKEASVVTSKIYNGIEATGVILRGKPEQNIFSTFRTDLEIHFDRLDVSVKLFRKDFFAIVKDDIGVVNVLKMTPAAWAAQLKKSVVGDIYYSEVNKLDSLTDTGCVAIVKVVASICYVALKKSICEIHMKKLNAMICDLLIITRDAVSSCYALERYYAENSKETTEKHPVSFTKANKVKRQCDFLLNWSLEFKDLLIKQKEAAVELIRIENQADTSLDLYNKKVDELQKHQEQSLGCITQLKQLMDVQSFLVEDLRRKNERVDDPSYSGDTTQTEADKTPVTTGLEEGLESPHLDSDKVNMEFSNLDCEDESVVPEAIDAKDEVFVAYIDAEEEPSGIAEDESERPEAKKQVAVLYSGVVTQLKNALAPVKSKMKQRERDAQRTFMGALNLSPNDSEIEEEDAQAVDEPMPTPRFSFLANGNRAPVPQLESTDVPPGSSGGGDSRLGEHFLTELRSTLNAGLPNRFTGPGTDYELEYDDVEISSSDNAEAGIDDSK